jgi:hypothetical protein
VIRHGPNRKPLQIESITFSWCDYEAALQHIQRTLRGEDDDNDFTREFSPRLQSPAEHGRCHHCAWPAQARPRVHSDAGF